MDWIPALSRWVHVLAGIMWVGLLFYFNFVQTPALKAAQADGTAGGIAKHVAPRALWSFRWAAVVTWLAGAALLGKDFVAAFTLQKSHLAIGVGAWLGTVMLANVWLLIWPAQKKALGLVPASDAERAGARYRALIVSRVNLALVFPMVFFMAAGAHTAVYFGR